MSPVIQLVGWALIHFVWQASALGIATAAAMRLCRRPQWRYGVACLGLAGMLAAPIATLAVLTSSFPRTAALSVAASPAGLVAGGQDNPSTAHPDGRPAQRGAAAASDGTAIALVGGRVDGSRLMAAVVLGWMAGVALLACRLAAGWRQVRRLQVRALLEPASRWQPAGERLARLMDLARLPRIVDSTLVDVPTVVGWLRPLILLPVAALANLTPAQVDSILAHELAHVRRHDYVVNILQTLTETLLFYHPAVWWVSARVRQEREHCCDEVAVETCGDAADYARALVELESWRVSSTTMALAATGGSLFDRVRRIMRAPADDVPRPAGWIVTIALVVLFTAGAGSIGWSHASSEPSTHVASVEDYGHQSIASFVGRTHLWLIRMTRAHLRLLRWQFFGRASDVPGAAGRIGSRRPNVERVGRLSAQGGNFEPPEPPEPPEPAEAPEPPESPEPPELPGAVARLQPAVPEGLPTPLAGAGALPAEIRPSIRRDDLHATSSARDEIAVDTSFLCFAIPCFHGAEVRVRGRFEVNEDMTDVERVSDGGYFVVRAWSLFIPHTIEIRSEGGRLTRRYFVAGLSRRYDDEARRLLATELNRLVRQTGFGAVSRVRKILAARGPAGVLDEVRNLDNDFVRSTYLRALFAATSLDTATTASAIALVQELLRSDFERSRTLRAVAPAAAADVGLAKAYIEAADLMSSDFEHARSLVALMQGKPPAAGVRDLIAGSAGRLHSDFEKSRTLRALVAQGPLDPPDSLFSAVRGMRSDFEKGRVLRQLLVDRSLPVAAKKGVLDVVPSISSDFEQSRVLRAMVDAEPLEPALRSAFLDAADHIGSSFEQNRVLAALVKGERREGPVKEQR